VGEVEKGKNILFRSNAAQPQKLRRQTKRRGQAGLWGETPGERLGNGWWEGGKGVKKARMPQGKSVRKYTGGDPQTKACHGEDQADAQRKTTQNGKKAGEVVIGTKREVKGTRKETRSPLGQ